MAERVAGPAPLRVFYGGTFDPVHCGHLAIARCARDVLAADIHLLPAADPPHRPPPGAAAEHRARMLEIALADESGLHVDRRELQRASDHPDVPSYSVDTLAGLRVELGDSAPIAWLLGADSFLDLPKWNRWRRMFELAHLVVAEREGSPVDRALPPELATAIEGRRRATPDPLRRAPAGCVLHLRQPLHAGSATELRARIAQGRPWRDRVPAAVADYIEHHGLYGARA